MNMIAGAMRLLGIAAFLIGATSGLRLNPSRGNGHHGHCPPFNNGSFNIHQWQLYPDNAAFDFDNCVLYIRLL